jgi:hypothetical protein
MQARARLMKEIAKQNEMGGEVAVPLDQFFQGNDDQGSIGCNLGSGQPSIPTFYELLASLREKPHVQDIWVRITDATDPASWPYCDTVYVLSSLTQSDIEAALADLLFDEVHCGWMYGKPASAPQPDKGFSAYSVWWD